MKITRRKRVTSRLWGNRDHSNDGSPEAETDTAGDQRRGNSRGTLGGLSTIGVWRVWSIQAAVIVCCQACQACQA